MKIKIFNGTPEVVEQQVNEFLITNTIISITQSTYQTNIRDPYNNIVTFLMLIVLY